MPDFLTKLFSITIILLNLWLTTYSCLRLGNYFAAKRRNPNGSLNKRYRWLLYAVCGLIGFLLVWFSSSLPLSYSDLYAGSPERAAAAVYTVVFFFAVSIANSVSDAEFFDPPLDNWQERIEIQLKDALADNNLSRVRKLVIESLEEILSGEYGQGFYYDLRPDFYDSQADNKKFENSELVKAFLEGWHSKDNYKFSNASTRVTDTSLPLLIRMRQDRRELLQGLTQRMALHDTTRLRNWEKKEKS